MKRILVLGGTRFFGRHMVSALLAQGHSVTIATRGQTPDPFGNTVERIVLERTDADCIRQALLGKSFDVVCDSLAYTSNDVRALLDSYHPSRYVMTSSTAVYQTLALHTAETDFDPLQIPLKWCARGDDSYAACKQQAEAALRQIYPSIPAVAVRFPFVIGEDDYTRRLYFYVENAIKGIPMHIDNLDAQMAFVHAPEAGRFLAWAAVQDYTGPLNGASAGTISIREILQYVERQTGMQALLNPKGLPAPYNGTGPYSIDTASASRLGFSFSNLDDWIYTLLDAFIQQARISI